MTLNLKLENPRTLIFEFVILIDMNEIGTQSWSQMNIYTHQTISPQNMIFGIWPSSLLTITLTHPIPHLCPNQTLKTWLHPAHHHIPIWDFIMPNSQIFKYQKIDLKLLASQTISNWSCTISLACLNHHNMIQIHF